MVDYGITLIAFAVVLGALCYAAISPVVNTIAEDFNDAVAAGELSADTATNFTNAVLVFKYIIPMLMLGLCALYGITRAQESGEA